MQNNEYYLKALQNGCYELRDWVLSCFSVTDYPIYENTTNDNLYHMQLVKRESEVDRLYWYNKDYPDELVELTDYVPGTSLFRYTDRIVLNRNDLMNVNRDIATNYGNCLFNCIALIYPFGDKIPFMTGKIKGKKIEMLVASNLHDTPAEGEGRDYDKFYVDELIKHADAVTSLEGFSFTCVPTTSAETMVANPKITKRRDELLNIHKNELDKEAVIAEIQEELAAMDKASFKNDRAEGFYLSDKAYDVVRMKKFTMLGLIGGFGGEKPRLVTSSLSEGWQKEALPEMIDDIRSGSYSRGKSTAIAGAGVKLIYNAFQTVTITDDDCGQTAGMTWTINDDNYGMFNGRWMITKDGLVELTDTVTRELINKSIVVRTPMLCKLTPPSFCAKCAGKSISMLPNSVHITASNISSIYMNDTMKSMHGKSLKTKRYDIFKNN